MPIIDIDVRLITPAFAGAADNTKTDGLRPPVFKSLMRFWWRTMHAALTPDQLFAQESALFGSTKTGQGLRIVPRGGRWNNTLHADLPPTKVKDDRTIYFAYGPVAWCKERNRSELKTPRVHAQQGVEFRIVPKNQADLEALSNTLWLMDCFGTFGSRARRGWGSLCISDASVPAALWGGELLPPSAAGNHAELLQRIATGLKRIFGDRPHLAPAAPVQFAAFTSQAHVFVGAERDTADGAHAEAYAAYRGYHHKLGAKEDHGSKIGPDFNTRTGWQSKPPSANDDAPWGVAFGLPQNAKDNLYVGAGNEAKGRQASPVFIKVIRFGRKEPWHYAPVIVYLPSALPSSIGIYMKRGESGTPVQLSHPGDIAIREFMDGTAATPGAPLNGSVTGTWGGLAAMGWQEAAW